MTTNEELLNKTLNKFKVLLRHKAENKDRLKQFEDMSVDDLIQFGITYLVPYRNDLTFVEMQLQRQLQYPESLSNTIKTFLDGFLSILSQ